MRVRWVEPIPTCVAGTNAPAAVNSPGARQLLVPSSVRQAPRCRTFLPGAACAKQLHNAAACKVWTLEHTSEVNRAGMLTVTRERPLAVLCGGRQTDAWG